MLYQMLHYTVRYAMLHCTMMRLSLKMLVVMLRCEMIHYIIRILHASKWYFTSFLCIMTGNIHLLCNFREILPNIMSNVYKLFNSCNNFVYQHMCRFALASLSQ